MKRKIYQGETGEVFKVAHTLVNRGDGSRCAWCDNLVSEIEKTESLEKHLNKHDKS